MARHGPYCGICTRWVNMKLAGSNDPMAPSVDHIIAVADGGSNELDNMQLAHRVCNEGKSSDKGNEVKQQAMAARAARKAANMARKHDEQVAATWRRKMRRDAQEIFERISAYKRVDRSQGS